MSSPKITPDLLDHLAHLARLGLTDQEKLQFLPQLSSILNYFDILQTADTSTIPPSFQITSLQNITRPDAINSSLPQPSALSSAPKSQNGYFQVHNTIKK